MGSSKAGAEHPVVQCELREEKQKRSFAKRVRMANLVLNIAALSFLVTGCLGNPGGATRNKCPAKPPTIQEFNATEVRNGLKLFVYIMSATEMGFTITMGVKSHKIWLPLHLKIVFKLNFSASG